MDRPKVSKRGECLRTLGLIFILIGLGVALMDQDPVPYLFHTHIPRLIRSAFWIVSGTIAFFAVLKPRYEFIAFASLVLPPVERTASYALAFIAELSVHHQPMWGYFIQGLLYLLLVRLVIKIADWEDPPNAVPDSIKILLDPPGVEEGS